MANKEIHMSTSDTASALWSRIHRIPLVAQIAVGMLAGILLALASPASARAVALLGDVFVLALKSVAPVLVLVLVMAAIASHKRGQDTRMRPVLTLYVLGTFGAALVGVAASFLFPTTLTLNLGAAQGTPPQALGEVLKNLLMSAVTNPAKALLEANYIGLLVWGVALGLALRHASENTQQMLLDAADTVTGIVRWVIRLAPLGIFGLVAGTLAGSGFGALLGYARLLGVIVGSMVVVALVVNPLFVWIKTRRNPYPLVFTCLRESGITAFFTRSSAANIPVNLALCERLKLDEDTYSVSIPLGATINMAGAAITISVMSLAAAHTLGVRVDFGTALLLSVVSTLAACGASGVAGGSLLLIPMATSLLGLPTDVGMQVVAIGFVISVVQDSCETALNSSTDVVFTAAALAPPAPAPLVPTDLREV